MSSPGMHDLTGRLSELSGAKRALLERRLRGEAPATDQIPHRANGTTAPLSFAQQRLWFLDQLTPGLPIYNIASTLRLRGALNVRILERCLNEIRRRHDALRTVFRPSSAEPLQVVSPPSDTELPLADVDGLDSALALAREEANRPFNLATGPLFRASLLRIAADDHLLLLTIHHSISDGWSVGILLQELATLYQAFSAGEPSPLAPLPVQYGDFATWQRAPERQAAIERQLDYWRVQLAGAPSVLNLPADRPRPRVQTYNGAMLYVDIPANLTNALRQLSQREGSTLFMTLLAAFQVLLGRCCRQDDVVVGTPIAGRRAPELEGLIGCFINSLALRTNLAGNPTFRQLLGRMRDVALDAYAHQDVPFEKLVEELQPERSLSQNPIFQVLFALQNVPVPRIELPGLEIEVLLADRTTSQVDLFFGLSETEGGLRGEISYSTELFDEPTVIRLARHYETLLAGIVADPGRPVTQLPLLTPAERRQIVVDWNETARDFGFSGALHELVEAQVRRTPDATAVIFEGQRLSYDALNRRANQLARHVRSLGAGPGSLVGVAMERSLDLVVALLGVLKAGAAYVPLDPSYPRERLAFMMDDASVPVLLTQQRLLEQLPAQASATLCVDAEWPLISSQPDDDLAVSTGPSDLAYVMYTSGSTGQPKGAMNTHAGICNRLLWMQDTYRLGADDVVLQKTPFSFDVSVWEFFWPLLAGARLTLAAPGGHQDPAYLNNTVDREGVTTVHFVPSMLQVFLQEPELACPSLRRVICSGEALPLDLQELFFGRLPGVELHNLYGPTEAAVDVTAWACRPDSGMSCVPIGKPIANIRLYVVDGEQQPVPIGVPGELYIGGVGVGRGYLNRAELTEERFVPDPSDPDARLYRTGDLARYLPDGNIEFLGRLDQQVKLRGFRIELGEIEAALRRHEAVADAAVLVGEGGVGGKRLVAYAVSRGDGLPAVEELRAFLGAQLPEYMIPAAFVALDALPLSPNGKLDRAALPSPDIAQLELREAYAAPRTATEEALATIWAELLHVPRVGIHDNFFALGGHSLLATQIVSRVRETFRIELALRNLFEASTIAELALRIEAALAEGQTADGPIPPAGREGPLPLSFAQQRLWFLDRLEPNTPRYNLPGAVRLRGQLDVPALERSLQAIVDRHEALRTTFPMEEGQPVQRIAASLPVRLPLIDLQANGDPEGELRRLVSEEARRPFDLAHGPMLRALLLRLAPDDHVLALTMHHIVSDAWSSGVLVRELTRLYQAFADGQAASLPSLPIQYADFATWQRERLEHRELQADLNYWREQLSGMASLQLPLDRPRPAVESFRGAAYTFTLPRQLTEALEQLAHSQDATLFMTLLAGFHGLLFHYTRQEDLAVGSPVANRNHAELEDLIGLFVNTIVLRVDASGDPTFRELLRRVREVALGAFAHQDLPFDQLVTELEPERTLSHNPLVQVLFALQNTPVAELRLPGLQAAPLFSEMQTSKVDLAVTLIKLGPALECRLEYNTDILDEVSIARLAGHYTTVLEAVAANLDVRLSDLPLLTEAERLRLLRDWRGKHIELDGQPLVPQQVETAAAQTPDALAVACGDDRLSYGELNRRANRLARHLRGLGLTSEGIAAILLPRSVGAIVTQLAVLKAGGAFLPLDLTYPADRLAYMLSDSRAPLLITREDLRDTWPEYSGTIVRLDSDWPAIAGLNGENLAPELQPGGLAYVIYTSGSTGLPKGSQMTHRNLLNLVLWHQDAFRVTSDDRATQVAGPAFDAAVWEVWPYLAAGGSVHIVSDEVRLAPAALRDWLIAERISVSFLPTALAEGVLRTSWPRDTVLRLLLTGADVLHEHPSAPLPFTLVNNYGPTECSVVSTSGEVPMATAGRPSIGRAIANVQTYVLDPKRRLVPVGVAGELCVGGANVGRGYLRRPELTAERFMPNPFGDGVLYRTGDLVRYRADGSIDFLGRIDQQVKIRGFRIEPGEVETTLKQHPAVGDAVVVIQDGESGEKRLAAYVVPVNGDRPSVPALHRFVKDRLPSYMVPAAIATLDSLPLTPNGKIDREALPPLPAARPELDERYVAPQSQLEQAIAAVLRDLLRVDAVGIHDNFFELGASSLALVQVHDRLAATLDRPPRLVDLFQYPTVAALAAYLSSKPAAEAEALEAPHVASSAAVQEEYAGTARTGESIAIIGLAGRFPGAPSIDAFWENLRNGIESIVFFSDEELLAAGVGPELLQRPNYVKARAVLEDVQSFDSRFFGFNPREADILDPQQRLFLECAWEALESAGRDPSRCEGSVGIYAGASAGGYAHQVFASGAIGDLGPAQVAIATDKDHLTTRVAYKLNLKGPAVTIQTACSTSLVAVATACEALANGQCRMALAGGASIGVPQMGGYLYEESGILSPDGHCRAFDANARGTVSGSGVGVVVLKRLSDALADGDEVRAVIKGWAINNDGALKVGYTAPSVDGQAEVIAAAQARAGIPADSISYVEAHGTGTTLGDPIEVAALTKAFRASTERTGFCALGSLKTNIGHLDAAAGVAGLIKTVLALEHREIPPSLHFAEPNPEIDFAGSPFFVNTSLTAWEPGATPRRAGVSSFGIGGTNAHVVLQEAPAHETSDPSRPEQLLVLSAKSKAALDRLTVNLVGRLRSHPELMLADVAFTLQAGRAVFPHRRAVAARDVADAARALEARDPLRMFDGVWDGSQSAVAFLFPGQGAQHAGMALGLYEDEPVFRQHLDRCAELLEPYLGRELRALLLSDELGQTQFTQPAIFAVEYALAQVWLSWGVQPQAMLGHSIGEYVAACLAGVMSMEDALRLVSVRGRLIQQLPAGAMLAVPLPEDELRGLLGPELDLAAVNAPEMCVASGPYSAIDRLEAELEERGIEAQHLNTSHAFHSAMMEPVLERFHEELRRTELHSPEIAYLSNLTGDWITAEQATDPDYWCAHLRRPVRFADSLARLLDQANLTLLEVGPGHSLTSLVRRQPGFSGQHPAISCLRHPRSDESDLRATLTALGRLWLAGVAIDWSRLYADQQRRRVSLPTYPFERQRHWVEARQTVQAPEDPLAKKRDVADWFYIPSWKRIAPPRLAALEITAEGEPWLLFDDEGGELATRLERYLARSGRRVFHVQRGPGFARLDAQRYAIDPEQPSDFHRLLADLDGRAAMPVSVVHLSNARTISPARSRAEAEHVHSPESYLSLLYLAQALGEAPNDEASRRITVVSTGMQAVTGDEQLEPEKALAIGPLRVIPREYPRLSCRAIDIEWPGTDALIKQLAADLVDDLHEPVVAYRGRHRWVQTFEAVRLEAAPKARLRERGTYLITGGLGGVGLALAEHLATTLRARLILAGRSGMPEREAWQSWLAEHQNDPTSRRIRQVQSIEAAGGEVMLAHCDVSDAGQVNALIQDAIARFGTINGVIHAAGIPGAGVMQLQTTESVERALAAKVNGTLNLDAALRSLDLDFVALCSSLRSFVGDPGMAAYTSANAFLDAYAQSAAQRGGPPVISINWHTWREAGMSVEAALEAGVEAALQVGMDSAEGAEAFTRALAAGCPQIAVSTQDLGAFLQQAAAAAPSDADSQPSSSSPEAGGHTRPALDTAYLAPRTPAERALAEIWQQLLGIDEVGVDDNFFALGGDSVLGIQVVSRAKQAGLQVSLQDLFGHQTIAEMARLVALPPIIEEDDGVVGGPVALTPIQRWFFEQDWPDARQFTMGAMLEAPTDVDPEALRQALRCLLDRHDALRLRFSKADGECQARVADSEEAAGEPLELVDVSAAEDQPTAINLGCARAQASLDIERGPLLQAVLFLRGNGLTPRLLLLVHHLAVDVVSLRILIEDLSLAYEQLSHGSTPELPPKTLSFRRWSQLLAEYASSPALLRELDTWTAHVSAPADVLPIDFPDGQNLEASAASVTVCLSPEETQALLQEVPRAFNAQVVELLLTALAQAFGRQMGIGSLLVDIEGHGRDALPDGADVARTVGWFTALSPLRVATAAGDPVDAVRHVKEQLRSRPRGGASYGILRYLSGAAADGLRSLPAPSVSFLYLGQTGQQAVRDAAWPQVAEAAGPTSSSSAPRSHQLGIVAQLAADRLELSCLYSRNLHREATARGLINGMAEAGRELIEHARSSDGAYTPADFPLARLNQQQLEKVLSRARAR